MTVEKDALLLHYIAEWRRTYWLAVRTAGRIETKENLRESAREWYRYHQFRCRHFPRCKTVGEFWKRSRFNPRLSWMRRELNGRRKIHSLAFEHAWYKGIHNRWTFEVSYRRLAIIPKKLVRFDYQGYLCLRPYADTELLFEPSPQIARGVLALLRADDRALFIKEVGPERVKQRYGWRGPNDWMIKL